MPLGADPAESAVAARDINSSFIGAPFGVEHAGATIYGRVAAVEHREGQVTVHLAGVTDTETINYIDLDPSTPVYFTTSDPLTQMLLAIEAIDGRRGKI